MTEPAVAPAPPSEPAVEPTPAPAPIVDWRSDLPPDLQNHPTLSDTKSVESLARQHIESAALIGRKGVIPPADDSDAEMNRYYGELGRPESPELYKFSSVDPAKTSPEQVAFLDKLRPSFHSNGLTDKQADKVTSDYIDLVSQQRADIDKANTERAKLTTAELQTEWGMAFEARRELAVRAGRQLFGDETLNQFAEATLEDGSRVGDHPDFIKKLYENFGSKLSEDELVAGSPASSVMDPGGAQAEIDRLMLDREFTTPYYDQTHREHAAAQEKMKGLYAMANPEGA